MSIPAGFTPSPLITMANAAVLYAADVVGAHQPPRESSDAVVARKPSNSRAGCAPVVTRIRLICADAIALYAVK